MCNRASAYARLLVTELRGYWCGAPTHAQGGWCNTISSVLELPKKKPKWMEEETRAIMSSNDIPFASRDAAPPTALGGGGGGLDLSIPPRKLSSVAG